MTRSAAHDLDQIALGEVSALDALGLIRASSADPGKAFGQRVYVALKAATLRRLTARRQDEASAWVDLIRQSSALLKARGEELLGERLLVLSDMTSDWVRTTEIHDLKSVALRPHVRAILQVLHKNGGVAKRAQIIDGAKVGDANLSRILGTLEGLGVLTRDKLKERTVTLTAEGARLALEIIGGSPVKPAKSAKRGRHHPVVEKMLALKGVPAVDHETLGSNYFPLANFGTVKVAGYALEPHAICPTDDVLYSQGSYAMKVHVGELFTGTTEGAVFSTQKQAVDHARDQARIGLTPKPSAPRRYRKGGEVSRDKA